LVAAIHAAMPATVPPASTGAASLLRLRPARREVSLATDVAMGTCRK
jgi:hypothetical protein